MYYHNSLFSVFWLAWEYSRRSHFDCVTFQAAALAKENEALKERLNCYKETLEKNDRKEKIRDLNEQIVSLKIELSVSTLFIALNYMLLLLLFTLF